MSGTNNIAITISAADRATQKIEAVTKRIAAMRAPADRVTKSIGRFSDVTGITALGKGMRSVAQHSLQAFENVSRLVGPLGAITGAASVAGMARLASEWANYGSQLGFSAQRAGVSASGLQGLRGAAQLAGSSAESLTSGMTALNDNLVLAAAGRAPQAVAAFGYLGVAFRDANGHSRTVTQALPELADKIAGIKDPAIQAQLATMLFGGAAENLLPFLRQGSAGITRLTAAAQHYNPMSQQMVAAANRLRVAQTELTLSVTGLGNEIAYQLSPVLTPMLHNMAEWIANNRGLIAQDVKGWVVEFSSNIGPMVHDVESVVSALGGWKRVIEILIGLKFAGWAAGVAGSFSRIGGAILGAAPGLATLGPAAVALGAIAAAFDVLYKQDMAQQRQSGDIRFNSHTAEGRAARASYNGSGAGAPAMPYFNTRTAAGRADRAAWIAAHPTAAPETPAADVTMDATKRAFLDTLAGPESNGKYNIKNGGGTFGSYAQFPEGVGPGGTSTAAGRYQFVSGTWRDEATKLSLKDFSPANQDKAGWDLAATTYHAKTGRDLEADLKAGNRQAQIATALGPIWPSLPGGSQSHESQGQFDAALARNMAADQGAPAAAIASASGAPAAGIGGDTGASSAAAETKLTGGATLDINLAGFPSGTNTSANATGNLWAAPPKVAQAMPLTEGG